MMMKITTENIYNQRLMRDKQGVEWGRRRERLGHRIGRRHIQAMVIVVLVVVIVIVIVIVSIVIVVIQTVLLG